MTTGLRERKRLATRAALHEAALRLVAERGLSNVSVDDIADRAGVSPRTFFNYFSSKDDAVLGLDPEASPNQVAAFLARPADETPVQALRAVSRGQAEEMATDTELWPLRLKVMESEPSLLGRLAAGFGEGEKALAVAVATRTGTRRASTPPPRCWRARPASPCARRCTAGSPATSPRRSPTSSTRPGTCWPPACRHPVDHLTVSADTAVRSPRRRR